MTGLSQIVQPAVAKGFQQPRMDFVRTRASMTFPKITNSFGCDHAAMWRAPQQSKSFIRRVG